MADLRLFLQQWGIRHKTGIPHNPTGQAIVERAHATLKALILKQRRGNSLDTPHNQLAMALYTLNF